MASLFLFVYLKGEHAALQPALSANVRTLSVIISCRIILNLRRVARNPEKLSIATLTTPPDVDYSEGVSVGRVMFLAPTDTVASSAEDADLLRLYSSASSPADLVLIGQ